MKSMRRRILEYNAHMAQMRVALAKKRTIFSSTMSGLLSGFLGELGVHELGHYVASKVFGNDVSIEFRADGFHTLPYTDHVRSAMEEFLIPMGGPIADYAASISALIYANRAKADSTIRRPLAASYSVITALIPLSQSPYTFSDYGDFHYLDYFGIPKVAQVAATAAISLPIVALGLREIVKTYNSISEQNGRV